jgi:spermidine synthase
MIADIVDRDENPLRLLGTLESWTGVAVAALAVLVTFVPATFARLLNGFAMLLGDSREYALVLATIVASFTLLAVPAVLSGATFPVALRVYTTSMRRVASRSGNLYAVNTIGAILGSLSAGLLLVPMLGPRMTLSVIALLFGVTGLVVTRVATGSVSGLVAGAVLATTAGAVGTALSPYRTTLNFNQNADVDSAVVFHAEGVQQTVDVIRSPSGVTALVIGGNVEADDGPGQQRHFVLKGHLPLMLVEHPRSVLVIGLGMGITLRATARHPGVEQIDVIELSPEIVAAQAVLRQINGDVVRDPRVHLRLDDGRAFMKFATRRYDMITADPIHPKVSRVGYLYTREYYQALRSRLNPGGIVCQWMPLYQIAPLRLRSAIRTFVEVFPHATLWYVDNHALLLAREDSSRIDFAMLQERFEQPEVREDLVSIGIASTEALVSHLLMGPEELRAFVGKDQVPLNTDDHPYLEYFVPGDLFYRVDDNERALTEYLAVPASYVHNVDDASAAEILAFGEIRKQRLLDPSNATN